MNTETDHRVLIHEAAHDRSVWMGSLIDGTADPQEYGDEPYWADHVADLTVLTSPNNNVYRIEFLLAVGGPTETVVVDSRWGVTYEHSWGKRTDGTDCEEWQMSDEDSAVWEELAQSIIDNY